MNPWGSYQMPGLGDGAPDYAKWRAAFPFLRTAQDCSGGEVRFYGWQWVASQALLQRSIRPARSWPGQDDSQRRRKDPDGGDDDDDDHDFGLMCDEDEGRGYGGDGWGEEAARGADDEVPSGEDAPMRLFQGETAAATFA
eukprot:scaffold1474_cov256-Pinguiococcus_pyrenoidosus.AAC.9